MVQRAWWSVLLVVAFLGVRRLAAELGLGSEGTRTLAALAYALSPRALTTLGAISSETLPLCLAPWVLLPLVRGARAGSERRAALASGVALLCVGGVNAVATLWVVPLGVVWLLTREPGPRRRRLAGWWAGAVVAATAWWLVPLVLLGRYSPPFLDWIETARVTTGRTSLVEVLRGTSHWISYLGPPSDPAWRAGWVLVTVPLLVLQTAVVAALGLAGLARRDLPHRRFLVICALGGLVALTAGHVGPLTSPLAPPLRDALDGVLAPFRNVHKADPLLRLPLALGLAHLLARWRWPVTLARVGRRDALRLVAGAAVLGAVAPALTGILVPAGAYVGVPGYWRQTADYLAVHASDDRALLLPGASFADQLWGRTQDEVLQPLANSPWAVRDALPLAPAGVVRLLDGLEARIADGHGSDALAPLLARAGVGHLVVRNDLDLGRTDAPRPLLVHQALADSPGIVRVASFGPPVGDVRRPDGTVVDDDLQLPYPAVEVFAVAGGAAPVDLLPAAGALRVSGGPEALLGLAEAGLLPGRVTTLAGDPGFDAPGQVPVVTDTLRRVERDYGRIRDATSATLTAGAPLLLDRVAPDLLPVPAAGHLTVAAWSGVADVRASGSASDVTSTVFRSAARSPAAALDGDPATSWVTGADGPLGAWWEVDPARGAGPRHGHRHRHPRRPLPGPADARAGQHRHRQPGAGPLRRRDDGGAATRPDPAAAPDGARRRHPAAAGRGAGGGAPARGGPGPAAALPGRPRGRSRRLRRGRGARRGAADPARAPRRLRPAGRPSAVQPDPAAHRRGRRAAAPRVHPGRRGHLHRSAHRTGGARSRPGPCARRARRGHRDGVVEPSARRGRTSCDRAGRRPRDRLDGRAGGRPADPAAAVPRARHPHAPADRRGPVPAGVEPALGPGDRRATRSARYRSTPRGWPPSSRSPRVR